MNHTVRMMFAVLAHAILAPMGLLRRRNDDGEMRRFQMRQKLLPIGDDFWIEDADGQRARISRRWFRARDTYGVEIDEGEDEALVLAAVVAIEALTD